MQRAVGKEQGRVWSPSELQARWNATAGERHVLCLRDSSGSYRPQLSDHSRHREVLRLWLGEGEHASDHSLELLMEADPPIAIATHRRESLAWSPQVRAAHLDTWAATVDPQPALSSLWSLVLSDSMLIRLPDNPAPAQLLTAVHSARWAADERRWMPLADTSTADQACAVTAAAARARSRDRALRAIRCAIAAGDSEPALALRMLPWMAHSMPDSVQAASLAAVLSRASPDAIERAMDSLRLRSKADHVTVRLLVRLWLGGQTVSEAVADVAAVGGWEFTKFAFAVLHGALPTRR